MRVFLLICVVAVALATAASSSAERTFPVNVRFSQHNAVEFDPGTFIDAAPCLVGTADVTEVYTEEVHAIASGVDDQGNLIPPLRAEQTREESLLIVPTDPTLPTYSGHSTAHETNPPDSPNAVMTNTITLHGTDGSQLLMHENVHILVKANGFNLVVDHEFPHTTC